MKSNAPTLFPNEKVAAKVIEYAAAKSDSLPEPLLKYHAYILRLEQADLTISTFQAQTLSFLAKTAGTKRGTSLPCLCLCIRRGDLWMLPLTTRPLQSWRLASSAAFPPWSGPTPSAPAAWSPAWS